MITSKWDLCRLAKKLNVGTAEEYDCILLNDAHVITLQSWVNSFKSNKKNERGKNWMSYNTPMQTTVFNFFTSISMHTHDFKKQGNANKTDFYNKKNPKISGMAELATTWQVLHSLPNLQYVQNTRQNCARLKKRSPLLGTYLAAFMSPSNVQISRENYLQRINCTCSLANHGIKDKKNLSMVNLLPIQANTSANLTCALMWSERTSHGSTTDVCVLAQSEHSGGQRPSTYVQVASKMVWMLSLLKSVQQIL